MNKEKSCASRIFGGATRNSSADTHASLGLQAPRCGGVFGPDAAPRSGAAPGPMGESRIKKTALRMKCLRRRFSPPLGHGSALKPHRGFIHHRTDPHRTGRFAPVSLWEQPLQKKSTRMGCFSFGGATRNRTGDEGFADPCLTAWPWRRIRYQKAADCRFFLSGAGNGARTRHLSLGKAALYQMSYSRRWCLRVDLNHRHRDFQSLALPTELPRHNGDPKGARTPDLQRDRLAF